METRLVFKHTYAQLPMDPAAHTIATAWTPLTAARIPPRHRDAGLDPACVRISVQQSNVGSTLPNV